MSRARPGLADLRRRVRRELAWLLVAAGVGGLVLMALNGWRVPDRYRWDAVAAAVTLTALGLRPLTRFGAQAARPRRGSRRRRRATRHR